MGRGTASRRLVVEGLERSLNSIAQQKGHLMSFIDTLRTAFKAGGGARVPLARTFTSPWSWPIEPGSGSRPFEYGSGVRQAFIENPVAQRAVRIVAEGVGSAPLLPADAEALRLVLATSAGQSLLETLAAHLLLHGNGYVQVMRDGSGAPVELFALRPDRVTIEPGADGWPAAYRYKAGETTLTLPVEDAEGWPQVIHLKALHPTDDHYGAGCLASASQAVAIHNAASGWNRSLLENAARPSGALVMEAGEGATLTGPQFDRLQTELLAAYAGTGNAGRPMLLEGGLRWQPLSLTPADMDFAELKAAAARDIALAFGVPPMLLGRRGRRSASAMAGGALSLRPLLQAAPRSMPKRESPSHNWLRLLWPAAFSPSSASELLARFAVMLA